MPESRIDRIASKIADAIIRETGVDTMTAYQTTTGIPEVTGSQEADALHGPWRVEVIYSNGRPTTLDLAMASDDGGVIQIVRDYYGPSGEDNFAYAYRLDGDQSEEEVFAAHLRARSMCAGLNLTSLINGIHTTGE
jgi:hypothetical protein